MDRINSIIHSTAKDILDSNYLNKPVRDEKPNDPSATCVLIIEFDLSAYRGFDLGGHFLLPMFDWGAQGNKDNSNVSGQPYPGESERIV